MTDAVIRFDTKSDNPADWLPIGSQVRIPKEDQYTGDWNTGFIHWLRADNPREFEHPLQSSIHYTNHDVSMHVDIHGEEFIYVIEGSFSIELDSGERHEFGAGDAILFRAGLSGTWTYHAPFRQFVTIAYDGAVPERVDIHADS